MGDALLRRDLAQVLIDFLKIWIHQILYQRAIYPPEIFEPRKKYNVPIHIAVFPDLVNYIDDFVKAVHHPLIHGDYRSVALTIQTQEQRTLERFVFEMDSLIPTTQVPPKTVLESGSTVKIADVEQYLRAALLRICASPSLLAPVTSNCNFFLSIETRQGPPADQGTDARALSQSQMGDWIPSPDQATYAKLIPLQTIPADAFKVNTYVMETMKKGKGKQAAAASTSHDRVIA
ncbi:DNA-binding protein [Syncephalastrum racemosum]|uniref:DNA-binding protein n=1 Tax=Syncephalastrum racemosum TaxID=13706 RepID=A0A1X2H5S6_SYNRA|nr:DNA-binding protein [Syncephalastrum racemosum]